MMENLNGLSGVASWLSVCVYFNLQVLKLSQHCNRGSWSSRMWHCECFVMFLWYIRNHSPIGPEPSYVFLFAVWRQFWWCFLEQQSLLNDAVPVLDDDKLGHRLWCLVLATDVPAGGRVCNWFCKPRKECDCTSGRPCRPHVVSW